MKEFDFRTIAESEEFRCMVEGTAPPPAQLQLRRISNARRASRRASISINRRKSRQSMTFASYAPQAPIPSFLCDSGSDHSDDSSFYPIVPFSGPFPVDSNLVLSMANDLLAFDYYAESLSPSETVPITGAMDPFAPVDFNGWKWPAFSVSSV